MVLLLSLSQIPYNTYPLYLYLDYFIAITQMKKHCFILPQWFFQMILCFGLLWPAGLVQLLQAQHQEPQLINVNDLPGVSSGPSQLTNVNGVLYFNALAGSVGQFGTEPHTAIQTTSTFLRDIRPGGDNSGSRFFTFYGGQCYFFANNGTTKAGAMWRSNGTPAGTVLLKDLVQPTSTIPSAQSRDMMVVNGLLIFVADDGITGTTLFRGDGTVGGTVPIVNINTNPTTPAPRTQNADPFGLTRVGNRVFFTANNGNATNGRELWVSDGTAAGTMMVRDIRPGPQSAFTEDPESSILIEKDGLCYFVANDGTGQALWRSDGTSAGTIKVSPIEFNTASGIINVGNILYFSASTPAAGAELWRSDGTPTGTVMVRDLIPGTASSAPSNFAAVGGRLFFAADAVGPTNNPLGRELWVSDGTASGTFLVRDIAPGGFSSNPSNLTNVDGTLYFVANNGTVGAELWTSDGTEVGTRLFKDVNPTPNVGGEITEIVSMLTQGFYFNGFLDANVGKELWYSVPCPRATLTYASDVLCQGAGNALPNLTVTDPGLNGGVYSSTDANLRFVDTGNNTNSLTGEINVGITPPGTYLINYNLPGGFNGCIIRASFEVTILPGGSSSVDEVANHTTFAPGIFENPPSDPGQATDIPVGIAASPNQQFLYIADIVNGRIQRLNKATGAVNNANFITGLNRPGGIDVDIAGNIYVAESGNHVIRVFSAAGGATPILTYGQPGSEGDVLGDPATARFRRPSDVAVDASGNIYVADMSNHKVKRIAPDGNTTLLAGSGATDFADGTGADARFWFPTGIAVGFDGNLVVADRFNNRIRRITPAGVVTTIAGQVQGCANGVGSAASFNRPTSVSVGPRGVIFVADRSNHVIRRIQGNQVTLAASTCAAGAGDAAGGFAFAARFNMPNGIYADLSQNVFVADGRNQKLKRLLVANAAAGYVDGAGVICLNTPGTLTARRVDGTMQPSVLKWQRTTDFSLAQTWIDINQTSATLNYNDGTLNITENTMFRAIVQAGLCQQPSNFAAIVISKPDPPVAGLAPDPSCGGGNVTLTASGGANGTYRWYRDVAGTPTLIVGETSNTITVSVTENTTFFVSLQGVCESERIPIEVTVIPTPATPTASGLRCGPGAVTLTATGATGQEKYVWYEDAAGTIILKTSTDAADNTFVSPEISSSTNFYVRIINEAVAGCNGVIATAPATIEEVPAPVITGDNQICTSATGIVYSTPNAAGRTFEWTVVGGTIASGQGTNQITVDWGPTGGTVTVREIIDATNCDATSPEITVATNTLPTPNITGDNTGCVQNILVYTTPAVAGNSYDWTVVGGNIVAGQGTNQVSVQWTAAGTGEVSVVEGANGSTTCIGTANFNVTLGDTPLPTITGPDVVCENTPGQVYTVPNVGGDTYNWVLLDGGGTIVAGQSTNSLTIDWGAVNEIRLMIEQTNPITNCIGRDTLTVRINGVPAPVIAGPTVACTNTPTIYSTTNNPGNIYDWTIVGGNIVDGAGTHQITVEWTNATGSLDLTESVPGGGCTTIAAQLNVTAAPRPTPSTATWPTAACQLDELVYTTPNVGGNTYTWVVDGGTIIAGDGTNQVTVRWTETGTRSIRLVEASAATCTDTVSISVEVTLKPAPVISGDVVVCENSTGTFSTPDVAGHTYNWSITGGTITGGQNTHQVTVQWGAGPAGTLSVEETNPAGGGCVTATTPLPIEIRPTPTPVITGDANACTNVAEVYSTPAVGGNTYAWTLSEGGMITAGDGTNSITVMWQTAGAKTVSLTERSGPGCETATSFNVNVDNTPVPDISGPTVVCKGATQTYQTAATGNTFNWVISSGTINSGQGTNQVTVTWSNVDNTGSLTVEETSANGTCITTTAAYNVTLADVPTPAVTRVDAIPGNDFCAKNTYQFSTPAQAGTSYQWEVNGGTIIAGQGTNQISVTWGTGLAGDVQVTQQVTGTDCAVTSALYTANILPSPSPDITALNEANSAFPGFVCENTGGFRYQTPNTGGTFVWTINGNGTIAAGQGTNEITVNWGGAGNAAIIVSEVGGNGCGFSDTLRITIEPTPGAPNIRNALRCTPGRARMFASLPNAIAYNWYDAGNNFIAQVTDTLFTQDISATTTYFVEAVTMPQCISPRVQVTATLSDQNIEANVDAQLTNICGRAPTGAITLTLSGGQEPYVFQWSNGATTQNLSGLTAGVYSVLITDDGGCTTERTYELFEEFNTLPVNVGPDLVITRGETVTLNVDAPDAVAFLWTPARGLSDPTARNPQASPDTTTTYVVEVTNSAGCIGFDSLTIEVNVYDIFIPNTFSPNNDGENDLLEIYGNNLVRVNVQIYDRLGKLVYEQRFDRNSGTLQDIDDIGKIQKSVGGWDGTASTVGGSREPLPSGTYIWKVTGQFANERTMKPQSGSVVLMR
jgi:gliding motility-associated-like protein